MRLKATISDSKQLIVLHGLGAFSVCEIPAEPATEMAEKKTAQGLVEEDDAAAVHINLLELRLI